MNIMERNKDLTTLDEMIDKFIGPEGSEPREEFDRGFQDFMIGMLIRESRLKLEMTQEQLAEALGVTAGAVYKWEAKLSIPELGLIIQMADFFDISGSRSGTQICSIRV